MTNSKAQGSDDETNTSASTQFKNDVNNNSKVIDDKISLSAIELLKDPNLLGRIEKTLSGKIGKRLGVVREKRNKLYVFLIYLSSKPAERVERHTKQGTKIVTIQSMPQMLQIRGPSRGGKTHMANTVGAFFNVETVGQWSQKALNYMKLDDKDVLYFQELLEGDSEGSSLRLISGEDGGFTVFTVVPNDTGGFEVSERKIEPIVFVTTTTRMNVDDQLNNRSHIVNVDESNEQNWAILRARADKEKNRLRVRVHGYEQSNDYEVLRHAISKLDRFCDVQITCIDAIEKLLPKKLNVRSRSDYLKIEALIKLIAFLHQYQRPYINVKTEHGVTKTIFAMPQDIYYAVEIISEGLLTMLLNLEKRQREFLPYLEELRKLTHKNSQGIDEEGFTRSDARTLVGSHGLNLSLKTIELRLEALVENGFLEGAKVGRDFVYRVVAEPEDIDAMLNVGKVFANSAELFKFAQEQSRKFFEDNADLGIKMPSDNAFEIYVSPDWFDNDKPSDYEPINAQYHAENLGTINEARSKALRLPLRDVRGFMLRQQTRLFNLRN